MNREGSVTKWQILAVVVLILNLCFFKVDLFLICILVATLKAIVQLEAAKGLKAGFGLRKKKIFLLQEERN